jgi:ComEC/Rec2-related protein
VSHIIRYVFNWSNWFVFFLIICTLGQVYFSVNSVENKSESSLITFRVLEIEKSPYGTLKTIVETHRGNYELSSKTPLNTLKKGYQYQGIVDYSQYNIENKKEVYDLSSGIKGEVNIDGGVIVKGCDLRCKMMQNLSQTEYYLDRLFSEYSCQKLRWVTAFLAPDIPCNDIGTFSKGLLIGGVHFSDSTKKIIKQSGISHLVAVSGFQVVLLAGFIEWIFLQLRISKLKRFIFTILVLTLFGALVGFDPPIVRAILMTMITYFALMLGRSQPRNKILIYTAIIMLWVNPFYLYSVSFQLSFLATFGLMNGSLSLQNLGTKLASGFELIWINVRIFLITLPVILYLNAGFAWYSIPINFVLLPLTPFISLLDIFSIVPFFGEFIHIFAIGIESLTLQTLHDIVQSGVQTPMKPLTPIELIVYYTSFVMLLLAINYRKNKPPE